MKKYRIKERPKKQGAQGGRIRGWADSVSWPPDPTFLSPL